MPSLSGQSFRRQAMVAYGLVSMASHPLRVGHHGVPRFHELVYTKGQSQHGTGRDGQRQQYNWSQRCTALSS